MDKKPKLKIGQLIWEYLMITAGSAVAAFAIEEFLVAKNILDGGIVGISIILNNLTKLPLSLYIIIINIPFLVLGLKQLGKTFAFKAAYAMLVFSLLLVFFEDMTEVTDDPLLATVYGGLFLGVGVGLVMRAGGCVDGMDTLSLLISKRTSFSTGQIILGFNLVIYTIAGFIFGADRALYSILTYFITSKVIDMVETGFEQGKAVMIITENGERIADAIYRQLGRTVTLLEGEGLISGKKIVLYCVVTRIELGELKRIIKEDEGSAFATISDVSEIVGKHIKKKKGA
ncbi:MAG: YitT family protein [Firmicutes bacterium]|nr:YitT family protein [Bacillota bacterium]MBQ9604608.1 YitT family protein [Bacillota bacterium]